MKTKKNRKGQYLKEIVISILLNDSIDIQHGRHFIYNLIDVMNVKMVSLSINDLSPGFDILCGIKESHIVFSYWG